MKKKQIIGIVVAIAVVAAMIFAYSAFSEKPVEGAKAVSLEVVSSEGVSTLYELNTDAQFLVEVMDELEGEGFTYKGAEGDYGLMISEINSEIAEYNTNGAYWAFYVNGEYCNYGISEQPVEDGDKFQIVYTEA